MEIEVLTTAGMTVDVTVNLNLNTLVGTGIDDSMSFFKSSPTSSGIVNGCSSSACDNKIKFY